jgi:hypothetical protein
MPRIYPWLMLTVLGPTLGCSPSDCDRMRIVFEYLQVDTSDSLQPGGRAGIGFVPEGNPSLSLSGLTILAYTTADTAITATVYTGQSLSDTPDGGSVVAEGSLTLPAIATVPTDPNTFPSVTFAMATNGGGTATLNSNAVYFAVLTTETQAVTLGIATDGAYQGSYQTYGTSGWTPSPIASERVALSLQSPTCD